MNRVGVWMALLLVLVPAAAAAQKNRPPAEREERYLRGGAGLVAGSAGLGASLDVSQNRGERRLYRARLTFMDNAIMNMGTFVERNAVTELGLMVGRGHRFTRNYGSLSVGLAMVTHVRESEDDDERTTIGVPVEAQLISGGPLRLGASLFGNVNVLKPFAGFILSVQVGRVP